MLRALLVAALFGIPWTHLMARLLPDTPHLVLVLLNSLQIGLVLYNLLLALLNRPLLQDTLTATSVRGGQHGVVGGTLNPASSLVAIALVLAAHLVITIYVHERPLDSPNPSRADARRIERAFLEVMDLRTEVGVSRSSRKGELKLLTVRVWLPWAEWRPGLLEDAANIVLLEGVRPPSSFNQIRLKVQAGVAFVGPSVRGAIGPLEARVDAHFRPVPGGPRPPPRQPPRPSGRAVFEFGPPPQPMPELGVFSEHEIEAARRSVVLGIVPLQLAALCVMTLYDDEAERTRNVPHMRETGFDIRVQLQRSKILEAAGVPIGSLQMRGEILAKRRFATWKGREAAECSRLRAEIEAGRWQPDINPEIADDYVTVMQARPNH